MDTEQIPYHGNAFIVVVYTTTFIMSEDDHLASHGVKVETACTCANVSSRHNILHTCSSRLMHLRKLYSGGLVLWLTPEGTRLWDMWFTVMFRPSVDYIVTTPEHLLANIQWCLDNDAICSGIGARSHRKVWFSWTVNNHKHQDLVSLMTASYNKLLLMMVSHTTSNPRDSVCDV